MSETLDYIIVGGGISGRLMQLALQKKGASTLVFDEAHSNQSSLVAAGLANPLVGKFFTIGWRAPDFFCNLTAFYHELENRLGTTFYRPCTMRRIIASAGEQNIWLSKAHQDKYVGFCDFSNEQVPDLANNFGLLNVYQGGELNTAPFLAACQSKLPTNTIKFDHNLLNLELNTYENIKFNHIIFCEGYKVMDNPLFNTRVNVVPTKGELIEIETDLEATGDIYLGSVFLQHLHSNRWRVGSTYNQGDRTDHPTELMKNDLLDKLNKTLNLPYKLVDHYCGIRPASVDRKPILGTHPTYKNVHLVNGMGSKAVSLAPLLVEEMTDYLLNNTPLYPEVDIQRFW
jgi:glycine oxidase